MAEGATHAVLDLVRNAFPVEPVPGADALLNPHCDECVETSEAFGGRPWPDITLDNLLAGRETALLTPTAWRYYLPAVISWCVREPEAVDVIQDNLVYQLEPPEPTDKASLQEWFDERKEGFTSDQRRAIVTYLHWYRVRQEAEYAELDMEPPTHVYRALDYWGAHEHAGQQ
jgi:hypothetical protein